MRADNGKVARRLDEAGHVSAHADDAVGAALDGVDQVVGRHLVDDRGGRVDLHGLEAQVGFDARIFGPEHVFKLVDGLEEIFAVFAVDGDDGVTLARNGVAHVAAVDVGEHGLVVGRGIFQESEQQLVGIGALQGYVAARVPAAEPADADAEGYVVGGRLDRRAVECDVGIYSARAAHIEFALLFRVEVEKDVALEHPGAQGVGAGHAGLLVHRHQHFYGAVLQRVVGQHGQGRGHADAVVGAEGRPVGTHPFAVNHGLYRIGLEVVLLVAVLLRHHVAVALQDDAGAVLVARRGRLAYDDVACRVADGLEPQLPAILLYEVDGFRLLFRRTRYLRQPVEILPQAVRLQLFDFFTHGLNFFYFELESDGFHFFFFPASGRGSMPTVSSAPVVVSNVRLTPGAVIDCGSVATCPVCAQSTVASAIGMLRSMTLTVTRPGNT